MLRKMEYVVTKDISIGVTCGLPGDLDSKKKNLPAMQETWVQSLGWEDLEKQMATQSSILEWRIPWKEEAGGLWPIGHKEWDTPE